MSCHQQKASKKPSTYPCGGIIWKNTSTPAPKKNKILCVCVLLLFIVCLYCCFCRRGESSRKSDPAAEYTRGRDPPPSSLFLNNNVSRRSREINATLACVVLYNKNRERRQNSSSLDSNCGSLIVKFHSSRQILYTAVHFPMVLYCYDYMIVT